MAIRLDGRGDITQSHVLWRHRKSLPDVSSSILYKGVIYLVRNGGIVTTLDPDTGAVLKQGRLRDALDGFYASPVAGDDKVYMASEVGNVVVIKAGRDREVLATNHLNEAIYATPAIADGHLFARAQNHLYSFGTLEQE